MQVNFNQINFYVGDSNSLQSVTEIKPLVPFSSEVVDFLNDLSKEMMSLGKMYPDIFTFGFWCRKSSILLQKQAYNDLYNRIGKGIVFHSTPSNVALNFAYSFVAGLLAGNVNIVRLPAKNFPQVTLICQAINDLLEKKHKNLKNYIYMIKYQSNTDIHSYLSSLCNTRVIWGGDETINRLRQVVLPPRSNEITFADRYSLSVINSNSIINYNELDKLIQNFYNDTFLTDQNACTSPCLIIWIGDSIKKAQNIFWNSLYNKVKLEYSLTANQSVKKLETFYFVASQIPCSFIQHENFIFRIQLNNINIDIEKYKYHSGFFYEYNTKNINEVALLCKNKCQTITYFGLSKSDINTLISLKLFGCDRIVPIGKSLDFSLFWDGHDLIREMSRYIQIM